MKKLTGLKGRWQILQENPLMIADVAHNPAGLEETFKQLALQKAKNLFVVFGLVKEKKREEIWKLLPKNAYYFFTQAKIPRALDKNTVF